MSQFQLFCRPRQSRRNRPRPMQRVCLRIPTKSAGKALPVGVADLSIWMVWGSSHDVLPSLLSAERLTAQLDALGVMNDTIQDRGWGTPEPAAASSSRGLLVL
jgi:hypothetical protein